MSKTTILVVCAFAGAIILGTTTLTPADPGNGIPARVAALEAAMATHDHDDEYVAARAEDLTLIQGTVLSSGTIIKGEGFTVDYEGDGKYYVEFDESFPNAGGPTVILQTWGPDVRINFGLGNFSSDGFRVYMLDKEPRSFKFIAVGLQ